MTTYDLARARAAVQYLVDAPYGPQHITKIKAHVSKPDMLPFDGDQECLNELISIGRQNAAALDALIAIVESKRPDKNAYQREFMASKRRRDAKVLKLKQFAMGVKLSNEDKVFVLSQQYAVWNADKDVYLKAQGELTWEERNAAIQAFWSQKESELDAMIGK